MIESIRCGDTWTIEIFGHRLGVKAYLWQNHYDPETRRTYRTLEDTEVAPTSSEALRGLRI